MARIVNRGEMAKGTIILNEIEAPRISQKAKPGQRYNYNNLYGGWKIHSPV